MNTAIILAAGKSERMGAGTDKAFLSLVNKPVVAWSLLAFERSPDIDRIILVVRKDQQTAAKAVAKMFGISKLVKVVPGGNRRQDSVKAALDACDFDTRCVIVHDGARPLVTGEMIAEVVKLAKRLPAVTVGHKMIDTVKKVEKGVTVACTEDRSKLWQVQTPQAFQFKALKNAYAALNPKVEVTDDCQAVELTDPDAKIQIFETRAPNIKITTVEDLQVAAALLK